MSKLYLVITTTTAYSIVPYSRGKGRSSIVAREEEMWSWGSFVASHNGFRAPARAMTPRPGRSMMEISVSFFSASITQRNPWTVSTVLIRRLWKNDATVVSPYHHQAGLQPVLPHTKIATRTMTLFSVSHVSTWKGLTNVHNGISALLRLAGSKVYHEWYGYASSVAAGLDWGRQIWSNNK